MQSRTLALEPPRDSPPKEEAAISPPAVHTQPRTRWADTVATDVLIVVATCGDWLVAFNAIWLASQGNCPGATRLLDLFHGRTEFSMLLALTFGAVLWSSALYGRSQLLNLHKTIYRAARGGFTWSIFFCIFLFATAGVSGSTMGYAGQTLALAGFGIVGWRLLLHRIIRDEAIASHLRQRIVLIGWTPEAGRLAQSVWQNRTDPCEIIGYVEHSASPAEEAPANIPFLGDVDNLPQILEAHDINVAWLTDVNIEGGRIPQFAAQCEKEMVEFKIIPSYFPILLSAMHVETVCGTPILGIDRLPLNSFRCRLVKRSVDIAGSIIGLILTAPIIALFCAIVYSESPGAVFYKQTRMGRKGKPFNIYKIRSMRLDAEKGGKPGWTTKDDPRRLRIGALMRKWNIDELPQFWNVLKGEMSLVGPRPERPELIRNFKHEIEHYNARHSVKPGVTGWAQVNGLRGDTDLSKRIRYDLYYMEHWHLLLDVKIMFLTFVRHSNAC